MILKFLSTSQRNLVYLRKNRLKNTKLAISEQLTSYRHGLLMLAKDKLGKDKVWTMEGRIFARVDGRKIWIRNEDDIIKN